MLDNSLLVDVEMGFSRVVGQPSRRIDLATGIKIAGLVAVPTVVCLRIVQWMCVAMGVPTGVGAWRSGIVHDSRQPRVVTNGNGGWAWARLLGAPPLGRPSRGLAGKAFFVGAVDAADLAEAEGPIATANRQTLRNRELGQLGQTQNRSKRYKTGMFANLANLAKQFAIETADSWGPMGRRGTILGIRRRHLTQPSQPGLSRSIVAGRSADGSEEADISQRLRIESALRKSAADETSRF